MGLSTLKTPRQKPLHLLPRVRDEEYGMRPCLTSACPSDSTDEAAEVGDEHHRLGHLRQLLPVADETPAAGRQDAEGLLDAPAERDRDEAPALPRARGDGEDRAVPGGVAGDVLAGVAA